jgi:hypothetical protein
VFVDTTGRERRGLGWRIDQGQELTVFNVKQRVTSQQTAPEGFISAMADEFARRRILYSHTNLPQLARALRADRDASGNGQPLPCDSYGRRAVGPANYFRIRRVGKVERNCMRVCCERA